MAALVQLPLDQPHPLRPPLGLRELQAEGPIHKVLTATGDEAWLVTGYREVQQLFTDPRLGRSHPDPEHAARMWESALFGGPGGNYQAEEEDHARMRSLLQPHFSPSRVRAFRPRVEALVAGLLDELDRHGPPADLVEALALPLPIMVICELLGVPFDDHARFRTWTEAAADVRDPARSEQGLASLFAYGLELVAHKREHSRDDVISYLLLTDGVSEEEVAMLAMALLFSGHETTVAAIGMGALLLLTHAVQWQALRDDPSLIPAAVEEVLRAPCRGGGGIPWYARTNLVIGEVTIRVGELILLDIMAANHDEDVFPEADIFDITRNAAMHLAFGHGSRYCIGAPLARVELQAVFAQLIPRFPDMRLAVPAADLTLDRNVPGGGLARLPVTW